MNVDLSHETIATGGVNLHVALAGPPDGPLVVLLHGFPELWYGWRKQIEPLARAGFRVAVPDQRGYNLSDKPSGLAAYGLDALSADVVGLIDALGAERARIVGHDWGAAVAWWTAMTHAERVERMVILNVPHPKIMRRTLLTSLRQLRKSWYMFYFQLPALPERSFAANRFAALAGALRTSAARDAFTADDLKVYREAWAQPGALSGMINWYRAALRHPPRPAPSDRVRVPTAMIWGARDRFLGREMALPSMDLCDQGQLHFVDDGTHWLHHEQPERVNALLLDFLADPR